MNGITTN
jgi:hypothetical protein